jgi:hypothetical protein
MRLALMRLALAGWVPAVVAGRGYSACRVRF